MDKIAENIIVDLYEMRATLLNPLEKNQMENVNNLFQYNWLNKIISVLSDKYQVKYRDIEEIIRERSRVYNIENQRDMFNK